MRIILIVYYICDSPKKRRYSWHLQTIHGNLRLLSRNRVYPSKYLRPAQDAGKPSGTVAFLLGVRREARGERREARGRRQEARGKRQEAPSEQPESNEMVNGWSDGEICFMELLLQSGVRLSASLAVASCLMPLALLPVPYLRRPNF